MDNRNNYFQAYKDYFWSWEEGGDVIVIPNGDTIAYSQFVLQLIETLSGQGLPPFGSLLLAIAATNYSANNPLQQISYIIGQNADRYSGRHISTDKDMFGQATLFLNILTGLPTKYTTGDRRVQLFQLIFSDAHSKVSAATAAEVIGQAKAARQKGYAGPDGMSAPKECTYDIFYREFRCIALLLKKFPTANSLIEKLAGVPKIGEKIEIAEEQPAGSGDFIESLIENYKTFSVGTLIKYFWSGLSIPIHHTLPSSQPLGGISDLSNKGDFDKLLVSEFANDEWLFLSRIANREALYIHRENPPGADDLERVLLLDISLKSWGTPKVLTYALLLAIAKHPRTDIGCTAYAVGNNFFPIAFNTVDEVIDSLQILDGALHPALGLVKFLDMYGTKKGIELFFIASPETMRHPAVQKVISEYYSCFKYWMLADHRGAIDVYRNQHGGRKLMQQIRLPLDELWDQRRRPAGQQTAKEEDAGEMEVVGKRVPILYPAAFSKTVLVMENNEIFVISREKRLFRQIRDGAATKGWQLLLSDLGTADCQYEIGVDQHGNLLLLCFRPSTRGITIYDIQAGIKASVIFEEWRNSLYKELFFNEGAFYYLTVHDLWRILWKEGKIMILKKDFPKDNRFSESYKQRENRIKMTRNSFPSLSVLKNIDHIGVNERTNLVINNKHELLFDKFGHHWQIHFKLADTQQAKKIAVAATPGKRNNFIFPNGSQIIVDRSGMLILREPPDEESTEIYIPAELDGLLGIAAGDKFTGNMYYYPPDQQSTLIRVDTRLVYDIVFSFIEKILEHGSYPKATP